MTSQRTRARLIERLFEQGVRDVRVLEALRTTPRHLFVDEALSHRAYEDAALPIGFNQTLSQPYIVARMTELLLAGGRPRRVLEIGAGSGYQTAILAQLVDEVFSLERIKGLVERARTRLRELQISNVTLRHADGYGGWADKGPYDGILSAAAPLAVPDELRAQLTVGGRMVIPVGPDAGQQLLLVTRTEQGFETRIVEPARFVPLVGGTVR